MVSPILLPLNTASCPSICRIHDKLPASAKRGLTLLFLLLLASSLTLSPRYSTPPRLRPPRRRRSQHLWLRLWWFQRQIRR